MTLLTHKAVYKLGSSPEKELVKSPQYYVRLEHYPCEQNRDRSPVTGTILQAFSGVPVKHSAITTISEGIQFLLNLIAEAPVLRHGYT